MYGCFLAHLCYNQEQERLKNGGAELATLLEKREQMATQDVFQTVMDVILDRKEHPVEGSYTNYLFDRGLEKILKKIGEETAEVIIGGKNGGKDEAAYEICDLLYHVMVLMAEKGITWDEIASELESRHVNKQLERKYKS